ncbi:hypothetical protein KAR91_05575 [Candidatus Pacearchaeota archaeon]|nr:hypothetical protein [Candidatus Pacearchaeota archaeon]
MNRYQDFNSVLLDKSKELILATIILIVLTVLSFSNDILVPVHYVLITAVIGIASIYLSIKNPMPFCSPIIIALFFFLGYSIKPVFFAMTDQNNYIIRNAGWYFTNPDIANYMALLKTSFAYGSGIFTGILLAHFYRNKSFTIKPYRHLDFTSAHKKHTILLILYAVSTTCLSLFMYKYDIGKTGVIPMINKYRIAGFCLYSRNILLPIVWLLLWQGAIKLGNKKIMLILTIISLIDVVTIGFLQLSRRSAVVLISIFAALIFKMRSELTRRFMVTASLITLSVLILVVFVITPRIYNVRNVDRIERVSLIKLVNVATNKDTINTNNSPFNFIFKRVLGFEDIMAVSASNVQSFDTFKKVISKTETNIVRSDIFANVSYGRSKGRNVSGKGMHIAAFLAITGSNIFVFSVTTLILAILCILEIFFDKRRIYALSAYTITLGMSIFYVTFKIAVLSLIIYVAAAFSLYAILMFWLNFNNGRIHPE